jgi:hypothetical protein
VVTDGELERIPPGKAVWVLGWENRLRGAVEEALVPYGAALGERELRTGKSVLSRDANSVVAVARSPADAAQVIAFVATDRANALPGLGRKLPHYGKYGLLGFEGDEPANVVKEVWPVLSTPMTVGFGAAGKLRARAALPPRRALAEPPRR